MMMGSRRRPLGRSYSGNGSSWAYSPGPGSDGEDNGPLVEFRPERRSYLLSVRPENRSTFCAIIAQLTEETQPVFETTLKSYAVSKGADAKFTCIVLGYPQPEVTWYKDDEEMDRYCGLPKYEIFHRGNRHTLQLYKCQEEDAAIYQASARNHKGIVSCSGVLEVGTMTEYKIHQRWFARLKRNAEAKLCEIEQSRKQGKEKVEEGQLRRVSPDRFQRKRRLTGDVGMRSGTSLWDQEEAAKVRIPDGKPCFGEEENAKSQEAPRNAPALFSNDFIAGHLEADVATPNGDSSLESGEENGERSDNGFLQYIYETVEIVSKELSAKKKKKEEDAKRDVSQQEDGMQRRRNILMQKDAVPVDSSQKVSSRTINGGPVDPRPQETPTSPSAPPKADAHFSLKEMYSDIGAKPEREPKVPEGQARPAEKALPIRGPSSGEEPPAAPLKRAKPEGARKEMKAERKAEGVQTKHCKMAASRTTKDLTAQQFQPPGQTVEPRTGVREGLMAEGPNSSSLGRDFLQENQSVGSPPPFAKEDGGEALFIRETDLLDSSPSVAEPVLRLQESQPADLPRPLQEAKPAQEQLPGPRPSEASENWSAASDLQSPDSRLQEGTNQEAASVSFGKGVPRDLEAKRAEEQSAPSPDIQDSSVGMISQKDDLASIFQNPPMSSQNLSAISSGVTEPKRTEHLLKKDGVESDLPGLGQDESQHGRPPDHVNNKIMTPGLPAQEVDFKARSTVQLDQASSRTDGVREEKQDETVELHKDNKLSPKMQVSPEGKRPSAVTGRPLPLPEVVIGTSSPSQIASEGLPPVSTVITSTVLHDAPKPALPSSVKEGPAERDQGEAHWLKDVESEREISQPSQPVASEAVQQVNSASVKEIHVQEEPLVPPESKGEQQALTHGKKVEVEDRTKEKMTAEIPSVENFPQPESVMEENPTWEKEQHKNLVSSLKNYLLLLLKMTTESDRNKGSPRKDAKAVEEKTPPTALPKHLPEVGIAGLTPRTSRKIFERVETDQLFQSAESLPLTPKTSRRLTGVINQELLACQERLAVGLEAPSPPCVPSIVVGNIVGELARLPGSPTLEGASEVPPALPSATPQELASGARRKIYLPKAKQADEMEGGALEGQAWAKRDSPSVSPQQSRRSQAVLQPRAPTSPPLEKCSPNQTRKMATLEVPKMYEELAEEESVDKSGSEAETVESGKANDRFKAPQVIRKIRAEQFSDASGNLKLWCQFFNILTDSRLIWYKDKLPVAEVKRSSGDEGQAALAIVQMSMKDCGVYQCTIQNEYGTDTTNFLMSPEVMSGFLSKEDMEAGEEIEMTPMVFAKGLADSGFWGDKFFGRIMVEDLEAGQGFLRKACRARAIYGLEPVFESGHTGIIKIHNLIAFGGRSENTLVERNYDITIQECKIQNSSREYGKIFAAEARAVPDFGPVPEIIPLYLIYRPANNIPYATMEEDLPGLFERYCGRERDARTLTAANPSEVGQKCCAFQHWLYQWTNGNILVTDLEGVEWKVTNVRIATKTKGYQGLKESCCPNLLDHFVATHQCNHYCELLALKSLDVPQPPPRTKGSRSPNTGRKASSAQSSPQLQKKGLSSPQATRKGSVSPKSTRKGPENVAESPSVARPKGGDLSMAGRLQ